ncbi:MAG: glycosyltransferase [Bacteroidia bacterium]|nr:glycosyltransferase [Bacteroidia bacterium]
MNNKQVYGKVKDPLFSILVPSWNNIAYLKVCVDSIRKNSTYPHQIIVHVNDGSDGTLEWVREQQIDHTQSEGNIGICHALNAASALSVTDYISYMNDDMYVLPDWDAHLFTEIRNIGHLDFFLSATMIEPRKNGNDPNIISPQDYGDISGNFEEEKLLKEYKDFPMNDWSGASWPPNVVHRSIWEAVGGYSVEFSPGLYSDPDFSMKLWKHGVRVFKGLGKSRVYHFMSKSLNRIELNDGRSQFMKKWGITPGYLYRSMLKMGMPWKGRLKEPFKGIAYGISKWKAGKII